MSGVEDFAKWLVQQYGLPGLFIACSLYVNRVLWKDNKDLRARNDRWTDRYMAISAVAALEPERKP